MTSTLERTRTFARAYIGKASAVAEKPTLFDLKRQYDARLRIVRGLECVVDDKALPRHEREARAGDLKTQARLLNDTLRRLEEAGYSPSTCEATNGFTNNTNIVSIKGAGR